MTDPIARMIAEKMYGDSDPVESPVSVEALADWLIDNGFAEDRRGYGEQIAEALLSRFNVTQKGTVT